MLTLSAVADKKKIKLDSLDVEIDHAVIKTSPFASSYQIIINVGSEITSREQKILLNSAKSCHVHKILSGDNSLNIESATSASAKKLSMDKKTKGSKRMQKINQIYPQSCIR